MGLSFGGHTSHQQETARVVLMLANRDAHSLGGLGALPTARPAEGVRVSSQCLHLSHFAALMTLQLWWPGLGPCEMDLNVYLH